jgi:hypothetical protein
LINPYVCSKRTVIATRIHRTPTARKDPVVRTMKKERIKIAANPSGKTIELVASLGGVGVVATVPIGPVHPGVPADVELLFPDDDVGPVLPVDILAYSLIR